METFKYWFHKIVYQWKLVCCIRHFWSLNKVTMKWVARISFSIKHLPLSKLELSLKQLHEFILHIWRRKRIDVSVSHVGFCIFILKHSPVLFISREIFLNGRRQSISKTLSVCHYEIFRVGVMINSSFDKALQTVYKLRKPHVICFERQLFSVVTQPKYRYSPSLRNWKIIILRRYTTER